MPPATTGYEEANLPIRLVDIGKSRVYVVAERSEPALYHATRCLSLCKEISLQDWDLAFGYEALARSYSLAGDSAKTKQDLDLARSVPIEKKEYREPLESDLSTITIPT